MNYFSTWGSLADLCLCTSVLASYQSCCPACRGLIELDDKIYKVDGQWICGDCHADECPDAEG